jgi:hypothetical protein
MLKPIARDLSSIEVPFFAQDAMALTHRATRRTRKMQEMTEVRRRHQQKVMWLQVVT